MFPLFSGNLMLPIYRWWWFSIKGDFPRPYVTNYQRVMLPIYGKFACGTDNLVILERSKMVYGHLTQKYLQDCYPISSCKFPAFFDVLKVTPNDPAQFPILSINFPSTSAGRLLSSGGHEITSGLQTLYDARNHWCPQRWFLSWILARCPVGTRNNHIISQLCICICIYHI